MAKTQHKACGNCSSARPGKIGRLGFALSGANHVVALAGNPNVGKSTVFNELTGLRQHTGNWPGKTIARAEGSFSFEGRRYKLVDLPGTYSLLSASPEEEVARNYILFSEPDVTVVVLDATCLERNLNLALQVLQITDRAVVCVNLVDEARARGITVDTRGLSRDLGVPVVATAARQGEGIEELVAEIHGVATGRIPTSPYRLKYDVPGLRESLDRLTAELETEFPDLPNTRWLAMRLLEGDSTIIDAVRAGELPRTGAAEPELVEAS